MDDDRMSETGPDDMSYGTRDTNNPDERSSAPSIPPRGVPGDTGMDERGTGRSAGDGGVVGAAGSIGGISATPTGEIIMGDADTDTAATSTGGETALGNIDYGVGEDTDTGPTATGGETALGNIDYGIDTGQRGAAGASERGRTNPGGEAGSDFDLGGGPGTSAEMGGERGSDQDPDGEPLP